MLINDLQKNTNEILMAIDKHHADGEVVIKVIISPNLHIKLIEEVWRLDQVALEYVGSFSNIPVEISDTLSNSDFMLQTEKGKYRNDA